MEFTAIEEATAAAAGATKDALLKLLQHECDLQKGEIDPCGCGKCLAIEIIRNAPLDTSAECEAWLLKRDAAIRDNLLTDLRKLCNLRCQGCSMDWELGRHGCHYEPHSPEAGTDAEGSTASMRCNMWTLRKWLAAQSQVVA